MDVSRLITASAAIALAIAGSAGGAFAQADVCTGLEAQLAALDRGPTPGSVTNYRQYDASVARQRVEIDSATVEARRAGCMGGFLIFQPKPEAKCGELMATIDRMRANLQRLTETRDQFGASSSYDRSRRRSEVLQALAYNRCGGGYRTADAPPPRRGGFLEMLFGQPVRPFFDGGDQYYGQNGQGGTYRTLCVRSCDGYYFPISFSTVPGRFAADEQTCQSMCPGADVSLYTYRNPGEDPTQMVSLVGEPYTALPNAFRYRKEYDAACTCGKPATTAFANIATPTLLAPATTAPVSIVPVPTARPAAGEDPETLANRAGRFVPQPIQAKTAGTDVAGVGVGSTAERSVRIVGPSYYYGQ